VERQTPTDNELLVRIWCRRVYGRRVPTYMQRTKRGQDRVRKNLMRRYPALFNTASLRLAGLTRKGKPRRRA
jgi:hypothetical protein